MSLPWSAAKAARLLGARGLSERDIATWLRLHRRETFVSDWFRMGDGSPWRPRPYQIPSLESWAMRKVHCDGRDVGKTTEIEALAVWAAVACPGTEMLVATQCENHLFPLMNRIARRIQSIPEIGGALVEMRRAPAWFMRFANGFVLWGRIAGRAGVNFQGMHVDWQVVDEAQEMTETAWGELYQALNGGGRRWVYGVPNGLRNTFHRMTADPEAEQYNWPSSLNPEFTPEKDAELARLYGGRESAGYIHRVLGRHGTPAHGVFDLDDYLACVDEEIPFHSITLGDGDAIELPDSLPSGNYYLGCDLGYARDPSEFVVYRADPPHLVNVLRVRLEGVHYARQQDVIRELDRACRFRVVGIDCGNNGRAVAHNLIALGGDWPRKIVAVEFGSSIEIETPENGAPIRQPLKEFMTALIRTALAERALVFPSLPEREEQYAGHTWHSGANGRVVFDKGNDHIIDADRCALYAHYWDTREQPGRISAPLQIARF